MAPEYHDYEAYLQAIRHFGKPEEVDDLLRMFGRPEDVGAFHRKLVEIVERGERIKWLWQSAQRVMAVIIAVGAVIAAWPVIAGFLGSLAQ